MEESVTWGCGYARPTARMQYTASSFAQPLTDLFRLLLGTQDKSCAAARAFSRRKPRLQTETPDISREEMYRPMFERANAWLVAIALAATRQRPALRPLHRRDLDCAAGLEIPLTMNAISFIPLLLALVLSPLLLGIINRTKALFAGRRGQPLLQAYFDLWKLLQKGAVYSRTTTWVFRAGPMVGLAAVLMAATLVPLGKFPGAHRVPGGFLALCLPAGVDAVFHRPRGARHRFEF